MTLIRTHDVQDSSGLIVHIEHKKFTYEYYTFKGTKRIMHKEQGTGFEVWLKVPQSYAFSPQELLDLIQHEPENTRVRNDNEVPFCCVTPFMKNWAGRLPIVKLIEALEKTGLCTAETISQVKSDIDPMPVKRAVSHAKGSMHTP